MSNLRHLLLPGALVFTLGLAGCQTTPGDEVEADVDHGAAEDAADRAESAASRAEDAADRAEAAARDVEDAVNRVERKIDEISYK